MKSYVNELIYACGLFLSLIICAFCIVFGHTNIALFSLLVTAIFILFELFSLFSKLDNSHHGRVSSSTASLKPDAYSMPDEFSFQDGIEAVSEPVILHNTNNNSN